MFDPMIRMQSLLIRSRGGLVQAPNPKVGESAATVVEWQYRAEFSVGKMPKPPVKSFRMR